MEIYSKDVTYTSIKGVKKTKTLHFVMTKANILENRVMFESFKDFQKEAMLLQEQGVEFLNEEAAMRVLELGLEVIKVGYAEIDFEDDIIDKSKKVVNRFLNSLAYEALLNEITTNPQVLIDIMNGVSGTIDKPAKQTELQKKYADRTTVQNDNNSGQTEEAENQLKIHELRKQLELLEGGQQ